MIMMTQLRPRKSVGSDFCGEVQKQRVKKALISFTQSMSIRSGTLFIL